MACKYIFNNITYSSKEEFIKEVLEKDFLNQPKTLRIQEIQQPDFLKNIRKDKGYLKSLGLSEEQQSFLNLLFGDNEKWVKFFISSLIQNAAKNGYSKVWLPTGNTSAKVEGHTTLEEFKKQKEDRIKDLEEKQSKITGNILRNHPFLNPKGGTEFEKQVDGLYQEVNWNAGGITQGKKYTIEELKKPYQNEINQLKQELERVEREGFGALKPIWNFYENTITNILINDIYGKESEFVNYEFTFNNDKYERLNDKNQYLKNGKEISQKEFNRVLSSVTKQDKKEGKFIDKYYVNSNAFITDEYGNTWNEVTIDENRDNQNIVFQKPQEDDSFDKELAQKIQDILQELYPEIKLNITNNPAWKKGDNIFNQLIQDDYFEGNPKYVTEVERISNLILNKLKFKTKEFNGKYDESITDLQTYKTKVLNDLLKNIGITGNVTNLNELKERLNSKELQTSLKENLEQVKESKENFKNQLDDFYHTKRLLNNYLKHFDLSKYDSRQQARIKQYLPSLFKDNKFKSEKQAISFNKRRINSEEWANKVFNLDKITLGFLSNNAKEKKIETLLNYFKIEPKDAAERIYVTIENELNRRERFFTSEKTQAKINAKIAEEKIKADNEKAERERIRTKELNKFKESTVVSEVEGIIGGRNIHSLEKVLESEGINEELAIIKNNGYSLDKTPNGKKSNLYQSILALPEVNGNVEVANKLKSLVYSDNFTNWFGDWINNPEESSKIIDENGEPKLVYHGSGREYNKFSEEKRGSTTGKWKDRLSDSEMSFMFTDNPSVAFYYAIIERQQILREILYYVRKAGQEPTQQLITEMYEKYPSIKHWVNSLKEKGLEKTEILEEFKRIYREYSEIRELSEGGAIGNSNSYLNNMRTAISYLQENKSKILKNGFSKDIGKTTTATVPNLGKHHTVFFHSSKEYRTSYILADGRLTGFEDKSLNDKNIKDLTSEEYDKVVSQFQEDYVYLYNKIEDKLKAGGFQPKIYPVFLNAKSVNSKDFKGRPFVLQQGDSEELVKNRKSKGAAYEVADLVEEALNSGLDGSIIENIADPNVGTNYSVFKANQIKSIFNEGEYSSKNDSFYNQLVNGRIVGQANIKAMTVLIAASFKATDLQINNMIKEGLIKKECK